MKHLGIDYGTKKIGLALSDDAGTMGFPFEIVPNDERLSEALALLIETKEVGKVVIGESLDLAGNPNPVANPARALGEELAECTGVEVVYEPELYTTQAARRDPEGVYQSQGNVDAQAAALILTSYLSRHHG